VNRVAFDEAICGRPELVPVFRVKKVIVERAATETQGYNWRYKKLGSCPTRSRTMRKGFWEGY